MNKKLHNIYLIGPMGCGKTSVGRCLAQLSPLTLYDADAEIVKRTGVSIPWIFEKEGEAGFRKREADVIADLTKHNNIILATGGGAVVTANNRTQLAKNGVVVYLQVSIEVQLKRLARKKESRPVLMTHGSKEKLNQLNAIRHPWYCDIADLTYNTDHVTPASLAAQILKDIKKLKQEHK